MPTAYEESQEEMREHIVQLRERIGELRDHVFKLECQNNVFLKRLNTAFTRMEETERRLAQLEMPRSTAQKEAFGAARAGATLAAEDKDEPACGTGGST